MDFKHILQLAIEKCDGKYVEDITKYLDETGIYVFTLENSDDHITNKIIIVIEIVDDYENVDN